MTTTYEPEVEAILRRPTASVDELARVIPCGRQQAYELIHSGRVRSIRIGRAIKVPTSAIRAFLEGTPEH